MSFTMSVSLSSWTATLKLIICSPNLGEYTRLSRLMSQWATRWLCKNWSPKIKSSASQWNYTSYHLELPISSWMGEQIGSRITGPKFDRHVPSSWMTWLFHCFLWYKYSRIFILPKSWLTLAMNLKLPHLTTDTYGIYKWIQSLFFMNEPSNEPSNNIPCLIWSLYMYIHSLPEQFLEYLVYPALTSSPFSCPVLSDFLSHLLTHLFCLPVISLSSLLLWKFSGHCLPLRSILTPP